MRALAVTVALALLADAVLAAELHVRIARAPHGVRAAVNESAASSAAGASSSSMAVLGACPAQRTLTSSCVDPATLGAAVGASACVAGPDGAQATSSANTSVEVCANATAIAASAEGAINASGYGIQTVQDIGSGWASL